MEAGDFYEKYSTEDFILDERFQDWVMLGRDDKFWGIFCRKHPEKSDMVHSAREFIQTLHLLEHVPGLEQEQKALERFGKQISGRSGPKMTEINLKPATGRKISLRTLRRLAASVLILFLLSGASWILFKKNPVLVETGYGQLKKIMLPDNSLVYLNANSRLYFEKSLLGSFSREVRLEGEAFFKVEKDSGVDGYRKFLVHTNGMAVEVLGTTFNVRDRHAVSSVTLQTGKVLVNMNEGEQVTLQPGERVEINRKEIGRSHV